MSVGDREKINKPVMIFDGDCDFCRHWIDRWHKVTGSAVIYKPYQEILARYPQVTEEDCRKAVQLIIPDGRVYPAAYGVFKALDISGKSRNWLWSYEHVPFFNKVCEWGYKIVAHNRKLFSKVLR